MIHLRHCARPAVAAGMLLATGGGSCVPGAGGNRRSAPGHGVVARCPICIAIAAAYAGRGRAAARDTIESGYNTISTLPGGGTFLRSICAIAPGLRRRPLRLRRRGRPVFRG